MQSKQAQKGKRYCRDGSRLMRMAKGQDRIPKLAAVVFIGFLMSMTGCSFIQTNDSISNLSFSHDGKKVVFDRCRDEGCQIQVYDLATGVVGLYENNRR